jgi:hypothetical protein
MVELACDELLLHVERMDIALYGSGPCDETAASYDRIHALVGFIVEQERRRNRLRRCR